MNFLVLVKLFVSAGLIAAISEISKKLPTLGALVASLPLVSLIAVIWMKLEHVSDEKIATHLRGTFWYVLPSLPMFLVVPWLLQRGMNFPLSLGVGIALTFGLYWAMHRSGLV